MTPPRPNWYPLTSPTGDELLGAMFKAVNEPRDAATGLLALKWWTRIAVRYGNDLFM